MPQFVVDWVANGQAIVDADDKKDAERRFREEESYYTEETDEIQVLGVSEIDWVS